ncbi:MAG TPA: helix-turn-helix domain-containing protein [Paludibacteraceae bacterium]|nr:helix-turn-helix domain-containing protein [Paludibacteraceae bacterium]HQF51033.1 helix-turn-helix domain-containing protein [Paludibacteraceae bacterium]
MAINKIQKPCAICGKLFTPKTVNSLYCSKKCGETAYRKKKAEQKKAEQFKTIADNVPSDRPFISIPEAIAIYGVAKSTLYRLIRQGKIPAINLGTRLLRISRTEIEQMFPERQQNEKAIVETPATKLYNLEPENCYCINDISEKFGISPSTVYAHIRKYSIPTRQIGSFVYAPKSEIDDLYNNKK